MSVSRRKTRRRRRRLVLVLLAAGLIALFLFFRARMEPMVEAIARMEVENVVSEAINDAIYEQIVAGEVDYSRMIYFEKDLSGTITALKTNMAEMNRLKTEILNRLDQKVRVLETQKLTIPLGSVLAPTFLSGRGPGLSVRILAASNSDAEFSNAFSQAGINQTLHQIQLTVRVDVAVLLPAKTISTQVSAQVAVAETVLVGDVPGSYAVLDMTEDTKE